MFKVLLILAAVICLAHSNTMCEWKEISTSGTAPSKRFDTAMALHGSKMLVFGGKDDSWAIVNDTFLFDFQTQSWTKLNLQQAPSARKDHTMVSAKLNQALLYGGTGAQVYDDVWVFENSQWQTVSYSNSVPRYGHTFEVVNNNFYSFGGEGAASTLTNDLFQASNQAFTLLNSDGPSPRLWHSTISFKKNGETYLYLFGGFNSTALNDLWRYTVSTNTWTQLNPNGTAPSARSGHAAVYEADSHSMLIFGGEDVNYSGTNDMYRYSIQSNTWSVVQLSTSAVPLKRLGHRMTPACFGSNCYFIMFSGISGWGADEQQFYNDLWYLTCDGYMFSPRFSLVALCAILVSFWFTKN